MFDNILGHKFVIDNWGGKYNVFFIGTEPLSHYNACLDIAKRVKIPFDDKSAFWNNILIAFHFSETHLRYIAYFPTFDTLFAFKRFALLLNTNFLIDIRDGSIS